MAPVVTSGSGVDQTSKGRSQGPRWSPAALFGWVLPICVLLQLPQGNGQCSGNIYRGCGLPQLNVSKEGFAAIQRIEGRYLAIVVSKLIISSVPSGIFLLRVSEFVDHLKFDSYREETLTIPKDTPLTDVGLDKARQLTTIQAGVNRVLREFHVNDCLLIRLPTAFANLTQLVSASVTRCRLTRLNFDVLGSLRQLALLNLNMNQIRELIPGKVRLSNVNIETLVLSHNRLEQLDIAIFDTFKRLQSLDLQSNHLLKLVTMSPVSLPALLRLDLSSNNLTTVSWEQFTAPSMETLSLSRNQLSAIPAWLGKFSNLTTLLLDDNTIRSLDLSALHGLSHLGMLLLNNNQIVEAHSSTASVSFPQLYDFVLEDNRLQRINATGWHLPMLRSFNLERNNFTTVPMQLFSQLGALQQLYVGSNPLRCRDLAKLGARLQASVYVDEMFGNGCTVGSPFVVNPQLTICCVQ